MCILYQMSCCSVCFWRYEMHLRLNKVGAAYRTEVLRDDLLKSWLNFECYWFKRSLKMWNFAVLLTSRFVPICVNLGEIENYFKNIMQSFWNLCSLNWVLLLKWMSTNCYFWYMASGLVFSSIWTFCLKGA